MSVSAILSKYTDAVPRQLEAFDVIAGFLSEESKKYNLTALHDEHDVAMLHFYDSLTVAKMISGKVIDIRLRRGVPFAAAGGVPSGLHGDDAGQHAPQGRVCRNRRTAFRYGKRKGVLRTCPEELSRLPEHRETYAHGGVTRGSRAQCSLRMGASFCPCGRVIYSDEGSCRTRRGRAQCARARGARRRDP